MSYVPPSRHQPVAGRLSPPKASIQRIWFLWLGERGGVSIIYACGIEHKTMNPFESLDVYLHY